MAQCFRDEAQTVELEPRGLNVKPFPRRLQFRGGGIAAIYIFNFGSNITFETNLDFTLTMYIQPAIIDSHSTTHHSFPDDFQIHISACLDKIFQLLHSMQSCKGDNNA